MLKFKKKAKIDYESIVYISSSLETYISAGINFVKALELINTGLTNKAYKSSIQRVAKRINEGESIASSFSEEEDLYTSVFADMLFVAEHSGRIEKVLHNMTIHFEKKLKLNNEVKQALMYPKFICTAVFIVFILFLDIVLPNIVSMYESLDAKMSVVTNTLIAINDFFTRYNIYAVTGVTLIIIFLVYCILKKKLKDKDIFRRLDIRKRYKEISIIGILKLVLESGIPVVYALERLSHSIAQGHTREYINDILVSLRKGHDIYYAIEKIDVISDVSKSFILSGEKSGKLDATISRLLDILENNFSKKLKSYVTKVEPISICVLGVMVLGLMLMVFVPMYEYMHYV
ncbi:MAG: type II secretion system F family protein [Sarcina sp.]